MPSYCPLDGKKLKCSVEGSALMIPKSAVPFYGILFVSTVGKYCQNLLQPRNSGFSERCDKSGACITSQVTSQKTAYL
jgi:hypothetical protein